MPLSDCALDVLDKAGGLAAADGGVFPSPRGRVLHRKYLLKLMRALGVDAVPLELLRLDECTDAPREVCELALG